MVHVCIYILYNNMSNFKLILTSIKKIQFMVQLLNGFVFYPLDVVHVGC